MLLFEGKKKPHIKKPLNAFMLYMKEMRPKVTMIMMMTIIMKMIMVVIIIISFMLLMKEMRPKMTETITMVLKIVVTAIKIVIRSRCGICQSRQCRRQCKIFASGVNFSILTHFLCFVLKKLLKLGEIDGVKFLA